MKGLAGSDTQAPVRSSQPSKPPIFRRRIRGARYTSNRDPFQTRTRARRAKSNTDRRAQAAPPGTLSRQHRRRRPNRLVLRRLPGNVGVHILRDRRARGSRRDAKPVNRTRMLARARMNRSARARAAQRSRRGQQQGDGLRCEEATIYRDCRPRDVAGPRRSEPVHRRAGSA
jgi:hypothetical protein